MCVGFLINGQRRGLAAHRRAVQEIPKSHAVSEAARNFSHAPTRGPVFPVNVMLPAWERHVVGVVALFAPAVCFARSRRNAVELAGSALPISLSRTGF